MPCLRVTASKKGKDNQKVVPSPTKAPVIDNPQEFRSLNIVITNDDGFETDLIQSLFFGLQNAGHSVIMSAPYTGQSGTSGLIDFLRPILPTSADSPKKTIKAGAPGVGPTTLADMQYYVNGAVTGAVLNGIDVLAPKFFAGPVDLVISGPNEGNNVGLLTPHSGTVGKSAQTCHDMM
jgi:5'-nucleotidase